MPEVSIFFDREDERRLVTRILSLGARFVPDLNYDAPQYSDIRDLASYTIARRDARHFFVLFDCYDECPFEMCVISGGYYGGKFAIRQRVGGPAIDIAGCVQYVKEGVAWISGGSYGYFTTYRNTVTGEY